MTEGEMLRLLLELGAHVTMVSRRKFALRADIHHESRACGVKVRVYHITDAVFAARVGASGFDFGVAAFTKGNVPIFVIFCDFFA